MAAIDVMRRYLQAVQRDDWTTGFGFFSDDVVLHVPGRSSLAGEHRGRVAVEGYLHAALARSYGARVEVELVDMLASEERVALVVRERFGRPGGAVEIRRANLYRLRGDQIVEVWIFEPTSTRSTSCSPTLGPAADGRAAAPRVALGAVSGGGQRGDAGEAGREDVHVRPRPRLVGRPAHLGGRPAAVGAGRVTPPRGARLARPAWSPRAAPTTWSPSTPFGPYVLDRDAFLLGDTQQPHALTVDPAGSLWVEGRDAGAVSP